ncbi:UPF0391 membrane protein YtjA, partial [Pseudomonas sp. FEN]
VELGSHIPDHCHCRRSIGFWWYRRYGHGHRQDSLCRVPGDVRGFLPLRSSRSRL